MSLPDVCIVGAGPAGLAVAIASASLGLRVRILDAAPAGPIDKACGEGLLPDALACLDRLGVRRPAGHPFAGISFHASNITAKARFSGAQGLGVRRTELHRALLDRAAGLGVHVEWATPLRTLAAAHARYVVGADGGQSRVRTLAGLEGRVTTQRVGLRQHFAVNPWSQSVEVFWAGHAQAYVTPIAEDQIGVAFLSNKKFGSIAHALELFPELQTRLADATPTSAPRGALTVTRSLHRVTTANIALVGDASGSVDAITGEGMNLCFSQAEALAQALATGHPEAYERTHARTMRMPRIMSAALLTMGRSRWVRAGAISVLAGIPGVFNTLLRIHASGGITEGRGVAGCGNSMSCLKGTASVVPSVPHFHSDNCLALRTPETHP